MYNHLLVSFSRRIHVKFTSHDMFVQIKCSSDSRDFSAESCPYHTRQWRISYWTFNEVHEHKGNVLINFIVCISLIQIATESSVTAHFGTFNPMLGIHPSVNTSNLKTLSLVDQNQTHPSQKKNESNESNARNLFKGWWNIANLAQVYTAHPSVPQRYLKCKKKNSNSFGLG